MWVFRLCSFSSDKITLQWWICTNIWHIKLSFYRWRLFQICIAFTEGFLVLNLKLLLRNLRYDGIYVSQIVPFVVITIRSSPHSWLIKVPLVEQKLLTLQIIWVHPRVLVGFVLSIHIFSAQCFVAHCIVCHSSNVRLLLITSLIS
jgi:hypothetical protein